MPAPSLASSNKKVDGGKLWNPFVESGQMNVDWDIYVRLHEQPPHRHCIAQIVKSNSLTEGGGIGDVQEKKSSIYTRVDARWWIQNQRKKWEWQQEQWLLVDRIRTWTSKLESDASMSESASGR